MKDRSQLDPLKDLARLRGSELVIKSSSAESKYRLLELLGPGKTSAAWKAVATGILDRPYAIKFVLRSDYQRHTLYTEALRVNQLHTHLIAQVIDYGEPTFASSTSGIQAELYYAIVVEWVKGITLKAYFDDPRTVITPQQYLQMARDLCGVLAQLQSSTLVHNDLHDENIMIVREADPLTDEIHLRVKIIDTGALKSEERRHDLIECWTTTLNALKTTHAGDVHSQIDELTRYIRDFGVTDQEWIVSHLCTGYNVLRRSTRRAGLRAQRFLRDLPTVLARMVDSNPSRRLANPKKMYEELDGLWHRTAESQSTTMVTPFDLPYAELIRSDRQLMDLFSDEYPALDQCRSMSPTYLYGPRGCGKSTVLRSLSAKALLQSSAAKDDFASVPFIGIYVCCSSELRSRFIFMKPEDYDSLEPWIVGYFTLLLLEELTDSLSFFQDWKRSEVFDFGLVDSVAECCCGLIRARLGLPSSAPAYLGHTHFSGLRLEIRRLRDDTWRKIINRERPQSATDAQVIIDVCRDLERECNFLKSRPIVFLLDDYSNQRIPLLLQRKLNQAITFSKQSTPIFKVTSEYAGVDLTGLKEGREVREINVGFEYVQLQGRNRYAFLESMLEKRFSYVTKNTVKMDAILPPSGIEPALPMARAIRSEGNGFYYHGIDTIADLCSGDFAMGLDLVQRIFEKARADWRHPSQISPRDQHAAIQAFASHEFDTILYQSPRGRHKFNVAERLCWLSHEYAEKKSTRSGEPAVKTHLDIDENVLARLEADYRNLWELFFEMIREGIIFPLQTSRSAKDKERTRRYMVRRILLSLHRAPLGRDTPIKFHDVQRLVSLLTEPKEWTKLELQRTYDDADQSADAETEKRQQHLF